jgi:hypothetical protein
VNITTNNKKEGEEEVSMLPNMHPNLKTPENNSLHKVKI